MPRVTRPSPLAGCRIPYVLTPPDSAEGREAFQFITRRRGRISRLFSTFMNSPRVARHTYALMEYLRYDTPLEPKMKEIVICAVSHALENTWEWDSHAILARHVGVREQVLEAIKTGRMRGLLHEERLWIDFTKKVMARQLDGKTFTAAHDIVGDQGVVEVVTLIGCYTMLTYMVSALRVDIASGNPPSPPEDIPRPEPSPRR